MTALVVRPVSRRQLDPGERLLLAYILLVPFGSAIALSTPVPLDDLSSLTGAAASVALAGRFMVRADARRLDAVGPALWLVLLALMCLSWFWSIVPRDTFDELVVHGSLIGQAFVAAVQGYSARFRRLAVQALSASSAITGSIALFQLATGTLPESGIGTERFALVGGDPNITAAALLLPIAAALVSSQRSWSGEPGARRHLLAAALGVLAVALTVSRGGIVGLAIVVAATTLRRRKIIAWIPIAAIVVAAIPLLPALDRGAASTGRTSIWRIAIESCNDRCWLGGGLGSFPEVHEGIALSKPELATTQFRFEAHNIFVGALVELGFVGSFVLIAVFALAITQSSILEDRLGRAAFAGITAVVATNLLVSNLGFKYVWLALLVATIATARPLDDAPPHESDEGDRP